MSTSRTTRIMEVRMDDVNDILDRTEHSTLNDDERQLLRSLAESYLRVTDLLDDKETTIDRLRKLIFGSQSEKTRDGS